MEELIQYLLFNMFGLENVDVQKNDSENGVTYNIHVPKDHMGLVIGKEGKTIKAIRNILKVKATIEKVRVDIKLVEA